MFHGFQDLMAIMDERIVVGPDPPNDFHARIVAVRMDGDEPAAGTERLSERPDHALGLELERSAGAIRLRGDDQIVIGDGAAGFGDDWVEQEAVVLAIDDEHNRPS